MVNRIELEGYVVEVRHYGLDRFGIAQVGMLLWGGGHHRIQLLVPPKLQRAINDGDHVVVEGSLYTDHIMVDVVRHVVDGQ